MARRRKMDPERKAFINSLLEHYQPKDAQDIQDMLKDRKRLNFRHGYKNPRPHFCNRSTLIIHI